MKNMETYKEIPTLLSKAILGTLSEEEKSALKEWREESEEHERLYENIMSAGYIQQKSKEVARVDIASGYMNVHLETQTWYSGTENTPGGKHRSGYCFAVIGDRFVVWCE